MKNKKQISTKLAQRALNNAGNIPVNPHSFFSAGESKVPQALKKALKK